VPIASDGSPKCKFRFFIFFLKQFNVNWNYSSCWTLISLSVLIWRRPKLLRHYVWVWQYHQNYD